MEINNADMDPIEIVQTEMEERNILNVNQFVILSILTFGLYEIWWMYKSWRFFQQKEKSDILPALRALFGLFFMIPLLNRINDSAEEKGYGDRYSTISLFVCIVFMKLLSQLPDPYWLLSIFSLVFLVQPFRALNYAMLNSDEFIAKEQTSFNGRQQVLIGSGVILWILVLIGLSVEK